MNYEAILKMVDVPADKAKHFMWGTILVVVLTLFFIWIGRPTMEAKTYAAIAVALIGAGKEGLDAYSNYRMDKVKSEAPRHGVEFLDWLATSVPGALLLLIP